MIRAQFTLEDTSDRFEVDVTDDQLNAIDSETFLADSLVEALSQLKQSGYECNRETGFIQKSASGLNPKCYALIWKNGSVVGDPEVVLRWSTF